MKTYHLSRRELTRRFRTEPEPLFVVTVKKTGVIIIEYAHPVLSGAIGQLLDLTK